MTVEHLFFVPILFLLGFLSGTLAMFAIINKWKTHDYNSSENGKAQYSDDLRSKQLKMVKGKSVLLAMAMFLLTFIVTHFAPIPNGVSQLHELTNGMPLFDQSPLFAEDKVYQRLTEYGAVARSAYQQFTYTTDLVFPLAMVLFLFLFNTFVAQKSGLGKHHRILLQSIPLIWFALDLSENLMTFILIEQYPRPTAFIATASGYITVGKFTFLLTSFMAPALVMFRALARSHTKFGKVNGNI